MNSIVSTLSTVAQFSDDGTKRYLLQKTWDTGKPKLTIIMMAPSVAEGIALDSTTLLVLNNASRLGYGSVNITNLFALLNDFDLKEAEPEDIENMKVILDSAQEADAVVYAPGVGKAKNKAFQRRQNQVLTALRPMESKLFCLTDSDGNARFQHPLSPAVRTWYLSPMKVEELVKEPKKQESKAESKEATQEETKTPKAKKPGK